MKNPFILLFACLSLTLQALAGTITGQIQTPSTGRGVADGTLTFTLSQTAVVSGTATLAGNGVCWTDNAGNVVGLPGDAAIAAPVLSSNLGSGSLPAGTYFVRYTWANATGESQPSAERSLVLGSSGTLILQAPVNVPALATSMRVYVGTTSGGETLQGSVTVTGGVIGGNYSQSAALVGGAALPSGNTSTCQIRFNDELQPSFTAYSVALTNVNGAGIAGFPQKWYLSGGSNGTVNVSNGTPLYAGVVQYPQAIVSNPAASGQQSINGPLNLNGFGFTAGPISGYTFGGIVNVDGTKYACSDAGIKAAISDHPNGAIIETCGCPGTPQIASNVPIPQGIDLRLCPGATWQASSCPAFTITGEGGVLEGTAQGNPIAAYTTGGVSVGIVQAITGCTGSMVNYNIAAGTKGGVIRNIRLDGNSISTVTAGVENGPSAQVEINWLDHVSIGGVTGATASCLKIDGNSQGFSVDSLDAQLCPQGINAQAANLRNTTIKNSRITCKGAAVPCVVAGTDDTSSANVSNTFVMDKVNVECADTNPTSLVKVQNVRNYQQLFGWYETDFACGTRMIVYGDGSSQPDNPSIIGGIFNGDANANYAIEFANVLFPFVLGASGYSINTALVKNTSGVSSGIVIARPAGGSTSPTPADSPLGLVIETGNSTLLNDVLLAPKGIQPAGGNPLDFDAPSNFVRACRNVSGCNFGIWKGDGTNTLVSSNNVNNGNGWTTTNYFLGSNLLSSTTAPTISSGFGTSPSIVANNGTASFQINVGTGGTAANGVLGLPTATNGWNCTCQDKTTFSTTVFLCRQTADTLSSVTIGNFNSSAAAAAWGASDVLYVQCSAR